MNLPPKAKNLIENLLKQEIDVLETRRYNMCYNEDIIADLENDITYTNGVLWIIEHMKLNTNTGLYE